MRAAVMTALHKIEIQDVPIPRPKAREVLVRIRACGVCGSDVHYYNEGRIGDQVIQGPQVLGHEPSGDVAAVGKSVTRVKVGDRVAVEPAFNCRKCIYCRTGRANLCTDLDFLGMPGLMGSLQEYLPVPEHCVERVPKRISYAEAALLEPVSIAVHTIDLARSWKGKSVALLGAGPVGLSILLCAKAAGAAKIIVSEPIEARRRMAKRLGAKLTLDPDTQDVPAELIKATKGMGVDIAIEAAGVPDAWTTGVLGTAKGGLLLIVGIPEIDEIPFPAHTARRKELTIQNVRRSNRDLARTIRLASRGLDISALHTHTFPLERTGEALELVHHKADGVVKAMIVP